MVPAPVLVLHSDVTTGEHLRRVLVSTDHSARFFTNTHQLEAELERAARALLFIHDAPPLIDGVALLTRLSDKYSDLSIALIAGQAVLPRVVAAMQAGAVDYLELEEGEALLAGCVEKYFAKNMTGPAAAGEIYAGAMIYDSAVMRQLLETAKRIAPARVTVTIQGESGTGKELLARFIHQHSGRPAGPFVAMNCAALPESLAESELFGYERGAFTGADQRKPGKFELADGGTLLLDEIGELPLPLQAKLLRALQEKQIDRVGGRKTVSVTTRVIATTNRDLAQMVREGQFRQDLYYRLRVIPLQIPPLRQRREDIPLLIEHFCRLYRRPRGQAPVRFSTAATQRLLQWSWPGNVRELENVVARAVLISDQSEIAAEYVLLDEGLGQAPGGNGDALVGMTVRDVEKRLIFDTLDHVDQNRTYAAKMLGISIRTLRNKLREYREAYPTAPRAVADGCSME